MRADHVVLTRSDADNQALRRLLEARGVRCLSYPCIATQDAEPSEEDVGVLLAAGPLAAVAFPSRRAVTGLLAQPALVGRLALPGSATVGAVGPATQKVLEAHGWPVQVLADPATGEALARALGRRLPPGACVLIPAGDKLRPTLPEMLTAQGLIAKPLLVYRHVACRPEPLASPPPAVVVCASPSAAQAFLESNPELTTVPFAAIGPTTAEALRQRGVHRVAQAPHPTTHSLATVVLGLLGIQ